MSNGGSLPTQLVERLGYWDKKMPRAINGMKECTRCREVKSVSEFYKKSRALDGYQYSCKICVTPYQTQYRIDNQERLREYKKQYHIEHAAEIIERVAQWKKNNPERERENRAKWKEKNWDLYIRTAADYRENHVKGVCAVYTIRNTINGKIYIGQSSSYKRRWSQHKSRLNLNQHGNRHLQADWKKFGADAFAFEVHKHLPRHSAPDALLSEERGLIKRYIMEGKELYNALN